MEPFIHWASAIKRIIAVLLFLYQCTASAQTMSLDEILQQIEKNNPLLISYQYKIKAENSLAAGARSWAAPIFGVGPYATPYSLQNNETFLNRNEGSLMFFLEQDIPNPARTRAKESYLSSLAMIDSSESSIQKNQLFTEGKLAYIDRFIAEKKRRIIDQEIDLLNLLIQTYTNQYRDNQADMASIYKSQARLHRLEAMRAHELSAVEEATSELNYLMNTPQSNSFLIDSVQPLKGYKLSDLDTTVAGLEQKSGIQKINYAIASMKLNRSLTLTSAKPDFGLRYEHYDMFGSRNTFSLTGSITIPIVPWVKKGYKSESLSMQQQVEMLNYEKQNLVNQSQSQIRTSLMHTIAEYSEVNHFEKEVLPAYLKAFEASLLGYKNSEGTFLITLMAWDDLSMAQEEYLYHLEQAYKSEIAYENAIEKE
jgi:cobalt-zinc-cadmium efflux system outer membrane protein